MTSLSRSIRRIAGRRRIAAAFLLLSAPLAAFTGIGAAPGTIGVPLVNAGPADAAVAGIAAAGAALPVSPAEVAAPVPVPVPVPAAELIGGGVASYYGKRFAGRPTASGEIFDPAGMTAAHRTLPFGSMVRVTDARTGDAVVVRINDRGPFHGGRVIDLSRAAAEEIGMVRAGKADVRLELLTNS